MSVLDLFKLNGRVALVTGGNRGIGRAISEALAEAGAAVAVASRNPESAHIAAEEISSQTGSRCIGLGMDVREESAVRAGIQRTIQELGGLHILVNNAGVNVRENIFNVTDQGWQDVIETNLTGAMRCCRAVMDHMREQGWGRIINVGSIFSGVGRSKRIAYCSSKHGIVGLTRAMALDLASHNITVNALCPGVFNTEILRPALRDPDYLKDFLRQIPLGRLGEPAELKGVALFLASEASAYMTGAALYFDGGWTAQ